MQIITHRPWLPYIAPLGIYAVFLSVPSPQNLIWVYPLTTIAVGAALWVFRKQYAELRSPMICRAGAPLADVSKPTAAGEAPARQLWLLAVVMGLLAIAIWIAIDPCYPQLDTLIWQLKSVIARLLGRPAPALPEAPFSPTTIQPASLRWVFIGFRVLGAVVVVPLMEELFWRAFLIRWLVNEDFKSVPVGTFTWLSFAITVALFGLEHREWLAGLICGALYNWLYYRRKDVFACVVAHAVSNAALAAWVLARGDWKFW